MTRSPHGIIAAKCGWFPQKGKASNNGSQQWGRQGTSFATSGTSSCNCKHFSPTLLCNMFVRQSQMMRFCNTLLECFCTALFLDTPLQHSLQHHLATTCSNTTLVYNTLCATLFSHWKWQGNLAKYRACHTKWISRRRRFALHKMRFGRGRDNAFDRVRE